MPLSDVLREDMERLCTSPLLPLDELRGRRILVTGATGLIGSLFVRFLLYANRRLKLGVDILALVRSEAKLRAVLSEDADDGALTPLLCDLTTDPICLPGRVDYILHAAAVTTSRTMVEDPVGTIDTAVTGMKKVMELAREKHTRGVAYLSSMEVYGSLPDGEPAEEDRLGQIDLSLVRSSYPESKRLCECMATAYAAQHALRVCSLRLAQTFGAGVLPGEGRVFAQFARAAMQGQDIVLHTTGQSHGNYVYTRDALAAILLLLLRGQAGEAYNVCNEEAHTTIADMAEMVAREIAGGRIRVRIELPEGDQNYGYAPDTRLFLSARKLRTLGWVPEVGLVDAYRRMIADGRLFEMTER